MPAGIETRPRILIRGHQPESAGRASAPRYNLEDTGHRKKQTQTRRVHGANATSPREPKGPKLLWLNTNVGSSRIWMLSW